MTNEMKKLFLILTLAAAFNGANAATFTTAGNGTEWSFKLLSQTEGSGVTAGNNEGEYVLDGTVVIAADDSFVLDDGITVLMAQGAELDLLGAARLTPANGARFTRSAEGVVPRYVFCQSQRGDIVVRNVTFEYVGLKQYSDYLLSVDQCTFRYHEASMSNGSAALNIGGTGSVFVVSSLFEYNKRSAIGGAANNSCNVTIEGCKFYYNDQANLNYPQINLTAAEQVVIRRNEVIGDRSKTMGGGIAVSNLLGVAPDANTLIEFNRVVDNRYGIAIYSKQTAQVMHNVLINNNTETTPNNGGSGINVYDPQAAQYTTISGNRIEGHLWGVTVIGGKMVNLGRTDVDVTHRDYNPGMNVFVNNGNGGALYDLYNNGTSTVYAQGNYWYGTEPTEAGIDEVIFHQADNPALGEVIFMPAAGIATTGSSFDLNRDGAVNVGDVSTLYNRLTE